MLRGLMLLTFAARDMETVLHSTSTHFCFVDLSIHTIFLPMDPDLLAMMHKYDTCIRYDTHLIRNTIISKIYRI